MNNPLVSVVITTFNRKDALIKAIESVFNQTYANMELIVMDDCSTDNTYEVILRLREKYPRLSVFKNEKNLGFVKNLNKGVGFAKGKYVARLDDDDVWCNPQKIEKQVAFLESNKEYILTGGGVIKIDKNGKEIIRYLLPERNEDIKKSLLVDNMFAHSTTVFKKDIFLKVGGYDQRFGFFADWALWLALGRHGKLYNFQDFFIYYLDQENDLGSRARDYQIRRKIWAKIILNNTHKDYYLGSKKSLMLAIASYIYSFIPLRKKLWLIIFKIRKLIFGNPPYQYVDASKK